jgi:hypothetical protein
METELYWNLHHIIQYSQSEDKNYIDGGLYETFQGTLLVDFGPFKKGDFCEAKLDCGNYLLTISVGDIVQKFIPVWTPVKN